MKNGCYSLLPEDTPDRSLITDADLFCLLLAEPCPYDTEGAAQAACEYFIHPTKEEVEAWFKEVQERRAKEEEKT